MSASALSLGLEDGLRFAAENRDDRRRLGRIVRAHTAAEVAEIASAGIVEPDGIDDASAYWSGFAHGVGRFLQHEASARTPDV
jgi:hypothetical protein